MLPWHTIALETEVLLQLFQHEPSLNLFVAFCMSATPTAFSRMWEAFIAEQLAIVFYTNREIASCCDCCVICDLKSVYSRCTDSRFWSDLLLISIKCLILVFSVGLCFHIEHLSGREKGSIQNGTKREWGWQRVAVETGSSLQLSELMPDQPWICHC